ncbi:MAG: protein rep [Desulfuromonadales bacterium]|nr:protein rep [Desulfuromonadales bacterium]
MFQTLPDYQDPFQSNSSLGTYTKSEHPCLEISARRVERWALKEASRSLLFQFCRKDKKLNIQKKFRVTQCLRLPLSVSVPIKLKNNVAYYTKLNVCGSVWTCPICASKITEGRRSELKAACDFWQSSGGQIALVTTTIPHKRSDSLESLVIRFQKARILWRKRPSYKTTAKKFGIVGSIRALEITYGVNGWHPHFHELFFYNLTETLYVNKNHHLHFLQFEFVNQWQFAAISAGIKRPSDAYGLDVRNGDFAADYVAKFGQESRSGWGVDQELTKGHIKQARVGVSPFDMLRSFIQTGDISDTAPAQYYIEYALSMFGKRQLFWSPGLKQHLQVKERSDQQLAEHVDTSSLSLGSLDLNQWRFILRHSLQGQVLEFASIGGIEAVNDFLGSKGYG